MPPTGNGADRDDVRPPAGAEPGRPGGPTPPADDRGSASADVGAPEVGILRARVAELEDLHRRAVADLDNLRKRTALRAHRDRDDERSAVVAHWLPVLDNLDLALAHADADRRSIVDGVRAVREQALKVLDQLGYPRFGEVGEAFDPARHEAVAAVPGPDAPAGTVVQVVRPGYGDGVRMLRPAAVVVASGGP
jgi:molecular chaperone GrpE